ncbi:MAG: hypothetical protein ACWGQW_03520 [bacterium]
MAERLYKANGHRPKSRKERSVTESRLHRPGLEMKTSTPFRRDGEDDSDNQFRLPHPDPLRRSGRLSMEETSPISRDESPFERVVSTPETLLHQTESRTATTLPRKTYHEMASQCASPETRDEPPITAIRTSSPQLRFKAPAIPRYKVGNDWCCFKAEFQDMVKIARLSDQHQLTYLRQAVPEEARKMLFQKPSCTIDEALEMLTDLYDPSKDACTLMQELGKITQKPGERLRLLAGRIEEVARRYSDSIGTISELNLSKTIQARFQNALIDDDI